MKIVENKFKTGKEMADHYAKKTDLVPDWMKKEAGQTRPAEKTASKTDNQGITNNRTKGGK